MKRWKSMRFSSLLGYALLLLSAGCDDAEAIVFSSLQLASAIVAAAT